MNFIFNCPITNQTFETDAFEVIDDEGVEESPSGEKVWNAHIRLLRPCPFCGTIHTYDAKDLPCPLAAEGT